MAASKLSMANLALSLIGGRRITTFGETTSEESRVISAVYDDIRDEVLMEHMWGFAQKRYALVDMTRTEQDDWATATAYAIDDIVYDPTNAKYYICLVSHTSDTKFATDLTAGNWELYTDWITLTVYAKGDKVYNSGVEYACLVNHTSGTFATDLTSIYWVATELISLDEDGCEFVYYLPTDLLKINMISYAHAIWKLEGARILSDTDDLKIIYTYNLDVPASYSAQFRTALASRLAAAICFNITQSASKAEALMEQYIKVDLPRAISSDSQQGTPISLLQDEWENARQAGTGLEGRTNQATWHPA